MLMLGQFLQNLDSVLQSHPQRHTLSVVIPIKKLYVTAGGSPSVEVSTVMVGFDWDNGKIFINPEKPLMLVEDYDKEPETIRKLQTEVGNLHYEIMGYKSQIASLKRKLKEIENEKPKPD